ncbi:hypothetical protein [Periweissella ghanensis]|uniref:Uncharacterized protein n=1 Tax=Periweissella ghanensis TaxID=467997 RepID=A0ABN8BQC6_9LACO|nr:hypothetical protein [Periweissella ghanensis]MCM0601835.1 hypothetical protein [Periweissella ghanensis]CAH0418822.1 hypothetical protein WGH24286_01264 [Periweissella ghanensis]
MANSQHFNLKRTNKNWIKLAVTSFAVCAGMVTFNITTSANSLVEVQVPTAQASKVKTNKRSLQTQVNCAHNLRASAYTAASFADLTVELSNAETILATPNTTQKTINRAVVTLRHAILNLVAKFDDPTYLVDQLGKVINNPTTLAEMQKNNYLSKVILASKASTAQQRQRATEIMYQNAIAIINLRSNQA